MSVELQEQRVRYVGNGTAKNFPFGFTIEEPSQVQVVRAPDGGDEVTLALGTDYSVALNADGTGSVTLAQALPTGYALAILSNITATQERAFYNNTPYYQEQIEGGLDKTTRLIQQLAEQLERCVQAPATMQGGGKLYYERIMAAVATAQAAASAAQLAQSKTEHARDSAQNIIEQAGDAQVERVAGMGDMAGLSKGVACGEQTWTLEQDVAVGERIELPNELGYIPGRHHLLMSYDGVTMSQTWYEEVPAAGDPYGVSHSIITKMPFRAGQELHVWVSPLSLADVPELVERVAELEAVLSTSGVKDLVSRVSGLEDALADLSRRVVYSEPEN